MFNIEKYREIKGFLKKTTDIIAISKNHPIESVEKAIKMGVKIFGENRVNEDVTINIYHDLVNWIKNPNNIYNPMFSCVL